MVNKATMQRRGMTTGVRLFQFFNNLFMLLLIVLMCYPLWHIVMYSLSDVSLALKGGVFLWPRGFSIETYRIVLKNRMVMSGFRVSFLVTALGSFGAMLLTAMTAYPISRRRLRGRGPLTFLIFFTMLFSGGMVPSYLLIKELGLIDSYAALILPGLMSAWNILLMRNFFQNIPDSLEESAMLDGASDPLIFARIILPVSKPVLATIFLFSAVGYWNNYFSTVLYVNRREMWSLQAVLRDIVTNASAAMARQGVSIVEQTSTTAQTVMMATVVIATVPILVVYPFLQKHFVQGVMIGAIKG